MAQTSVNFRIDEDLKKNMEEICGKMGMSLTMAITIFFTKVTQERRIPFEITADAYPFYSESYIRYPEKKIEDYKARRLRLAEHDLIEDRGLMAGRVKSGQLEEGKKLLNRQEKSIIDNRVAGDIMKLPLCSEEE